MKRLMISAFAAIALLAVVTTMPRSHSPSTDRPAAMMSLQGFYTATDVKKLPIGDFDDQSLDYSRSRRLAGLSPAGDLHRRGAENSRPGNLRCDQECGHDGWYADEPQELIHGKHRCRPPDRKAGFNRRLQSRFASSAGRWSEADPYRPPRRS